MSNPNLWHKLRRNDINTRFVAVNKLKDKSNKQLIRSIVLPMLHGTTAALCGLLPIWLIVVLAYTLGAFFRMRFFSNMHEISHGLVKHCNRQYQSFWLSVSEAFSIVSDYTYYRWHHISHHQLLGQQPLQQALTALKNGKPNDPDLFDISLNNVNLSYAHIVEDENSDILQRSKLTNSKSGRIFLVFVIRPFYKLMFEAKAIFKIPFLIYGLLFNKDKLAQNINVDISTVKEVVIVRIIRWAVILTILTLTSGVYGLLYLILSELFYRGFCFHPCAAYFLATHHSHNNSENSCQPTTSVYSPLMNLLCGGLNYHVEHHDFPNIPVDKLKNLNTLAQNHYTTIKSYSGAYAVFKEYLKNSNIFWVYGCHDHLAQELKTAKQSYYQIKEEVSV